MLDADGADACSDTCGLSHADLARGDARTGRWRRAPVLADQAIHAVPQLCGHAWARLGHNTPFVAPLRPHARLLRTTQRPYEERVSVSCIAIGNKSSTAAACSLAARSDQRRVPRATLLEVAWRRRPRSRYGVWQRDGHHRLQSRDRALRALWESSLTRKRTPAHIDTGAWPPTRSHRLTGHGDGTHRSRHHAPVSFGSWVTSLGWASTSCAGVTPVRLQ